MPTESTPLNLYEIRPTLKYAIRVYAKSREDAIAFWQKRGSRDAQGDLTEEAKRVLSLLDRENANYEPVVELIEEKP